MIHYSPTETNNSDITNDMIHLVDSGGQYLDGTTDVTRAFHFGKPTE
jgi:Xaa-Pro aminopeptidase